MANLPKFGFLTCNMRKHYENFGLINRGLADRYHLLRYAITEHM